MAVGAAAVAAAIADAIKASGVLVRVKPEEFAKLLGLNKDPLIVIAIGGLFSKTYSYLMSYKGLAFYTRSSTPLNLPGSAEIVTASRISIPG
jgi:hypothetical protein